MLPLCHFISSRCRIDPLHFDNSFPGTKSSQQQCSHLVLWFIFNQEFGIKTSCRSYKKTGKAYLQRFFYSSNIFHDKKSSPSTVISQIKYFLLVFCRQKIFYRSHRCRSLYEGMRRRPFAKKYPVHKQWSQQVNKKKIGQQLIKDPLRVYHGQSKPFLYCEKLIDIKSTIEREQSNKRERETTIKNF